MPVPNTFFDLPVDHDLWIDYATTSGNIHPLVIAFIKFQPRMLANERIGHETATTPALWQRVSHMLHAEIPMAFWPHVMGSQLAAYFGSFVKETKALEIDKEAVFDGKLQPNPTKLPTDVQYALVQSFAHTIAEEFAAAQNDKERLAEVQTRADNAIGYVAGSFHPELTLMLMKDLLKVRKVNLNTKGQNFRAVVTRYDLLQN